MSGSNSKPDGDGMISTVGKEAHTTVGVEPRENNLAPAAATTRVERSSGTTTATHNGGMADVTSMKTAKSNFLRAKGFEPKSSSGECTSGESESDKTGTGTREGSNKDSHQGSNKDSQSPEGSDPMAEKEGTPADEKDSEPAAADADTENDESGAKGKGARPKLPRPEGSCSCPRCGCDDTKFCYYNNYNIKQPRYFCKGCQRYWTAGGMLRNVPVGAGRRNKNSLKEQEKKAKAAIQGGPDDMHGMPAGSVYARNRHVLWDSDVSHDSSMSGSMGMHPSMQYMHPGPSPGMAPMVGAGFRGMRPGGSMLQMGHPSGPHRAMDGMPVPGMPMNPLGDRSTSSVSSGRSNHTMGPDMSNSVNISEHSTGGESAGNRPRQRIKRHSPDNATGGSPYGAPAPPGYHPVASVPSFRPGSEAVLGSIPDGAKQPGMPDSHWAARPPASAPGGVPPGASDPNWMSMGSHPAAAAAAAAAYQAAAGPHPAGPYGWPGMSGWGGYPWANNAAAGWAAAAAAAYQAGAGGWPPAAASGWEHAQANGAPAPGMAMHPPLQPQVCNGPPQSQGSYPPPMMGYPGGPPAMHGWNGWPSHPAPGSPRGGMPGQPMSVPPHQAYPNYSAGPMQSSMPGQPGGPSVLGKHVRSYE